MQYSAPVASGRALSYGTNFARCSLPNQCTCSHAPWQSIGRQCSHSSHTQRCMSARTAPANPFPHAHQCWSFQACTGTSLTPAHTRCLEHSGCKPRTTTKACGSMSFIHCVRDAADGWQITVCKAHSSLSCRLSACTSHRQATLAPQLLTTLKLSITVNQLAAHFQVHPVPLSCARCVAHTARSCHSYSCSGGVDLGCPAPFPTLSPCHQLHSWVVVLKTANLRCLAYVHQKYTACRAQRGPRCLEEACLIWEGLPCDSRYYGMGRL